MSGNISVETELVRQVNFLLEEKDTPAMRILKSDIHKSEILSPEEKHNATVEVNI